MADGQTVLVTGVFLLTVLFLLWRPKGMNEAVSSMTGAAVLLLFGIVPLQQLFTIVEIVGGAAVTILSTIVMSIVLESIGFFRWAAYNMIGYAKGSGNRLFVYVMLLCFLMTLFFNNDGSILITTPIILQMTRMLGLKLKQQFPYLISGALIATAASAPVGVSNLANLIALEIVGLSLNRYATLMFVPSLIGIVFMSGLLFLMFYPVLPKRIGLFPSSPDKEQTRDQGRARHWYYAAPLDKKPAFHPLMDHPEEPPVDWQLFRICISLVVAIRIGFFIGSAFGVPVELVAVTGACLLIIVRWYWTGIGAKDLFHKTPWSILIFAISIYVIISAVQSIGLTALIVGVLEPYISYGGLGTVLWTGGLMTIMSNLFNNLPSIMIGTLALTELNLDESTLQIAYLANIIGSDVGALLTPLGTLASLLWMFQLRKEKVPVTWKMYLKVTICVVPVGLIVSLLSLHYWALIIG
ncbi:arsenic transporter [Paenibacillus tarimensis]